MYTHTNKKKSSPTRTHLLEALDGRVRAEAQAEGRPLVHGRHDFDFGAARLGGDDNVPVGLLCLVLCEQTGVRFWV